MQDNYRTYSERRIGPQLQETLDSRDAQVRCSDVQRRAKVKITAGGIHLYNKKTSRRKSFISQALIKF